MKILKIFIWNFQSRKQILTLRGVYRAQTLSQQLKLHLKTNHNINIYVYQNHIQQHNTTDL